MYFNRHNFYDRFHFKVITPPTAEQITLDEARDHLRIIPFGSPAQSDEDAWITSNISVAREWCESQSMCALCVQTLELGIEAFPGSPWLPWSFDMPGGYFPYPYFGGRGIMLPMASPFIAIESIKYDDGSGTEQTLDPATYYVNDYARPSVLYPAPGVFWPIAQFQNTRAVRIRYTCGYQLTGQSPTVSQDLPFELRAAMLLVLGHLHENRENSMEVELHEIPLGAAALMDRYSVRLGIA